MQETPGSRNSGTGSGKKSRILVIQTAFLGDVLLSVPLLKNIRKLDPEAEIHFLCRKGLGSVLLENNIINSQHEITKNDRASYQAVIDNLSLIEFDSIYCPHESFRSALLAQKLRSKRKIAFHKWWNQFFFQVRIKKLKSLPEAMRQLQMLSADSQNIRDLISEYASQFEAGEMGEVPEWASMEIPFPKTERKSICIFPGSVWATKKWTIEGFTEIAKKLSENDQVILMGGKEESALGEQIMQHAPKARNMIGQTSLQQSLQILSAAKLVITNDSGGQHLAALVAAPTISIFGPTVLEFGYRPWNAKAIVVENNSIPCRPCGKHGHQKCPIGTHECMTSISSEQVLLEAKKLLGLV